MRKPARGRVTSVAFAVLAALAGCSSKEEVKPAGFTAAMVQGKTFYQEVLTAPDQQKTLITFTSATGATLSLEDVTGVIDVPVTWSIDANGRLALAVPLGPTITVTLVADATTYMDVTADDGTGASAARLYKTIPFGASLQDRFALADRDLAGATVTNGVATFGPATAVSTDGFSEDTSPWSEAADGSVTLSKPGEVTVVYLRADSMVSSPKSLHIVGRVRDAVTSDLLKIADAVLGETPAGSGFTAAMVEGKVLYRVNTSGTNPNRSIIRYDAGGVREEWYQDVVSVPSVQARVGTWELTPLTGSMVVHPTGPAGLPALAAMLFDDAATYWDLLLNNGSVINRASVDKTVAATAASVQGVWTASEHLLDGTVDPLGTITLNADGSGTGPGAPPAALHWLVQADGSILITLDGTVDTITFFTLATSAPPNRLELAGVWYSGSTFANTTVLTMQK